jgi:VIT1/CCC1 family predicted Fe2+/Mn2+ transporter
MFFKKRKERKIKEAEELVRDAFNKGISANHSETAYHPNDYILNRNKNKYENKNRCTEIIKTLIKYLVKNFIKVLIGVLIGIIVFLITKHFF